jgi:hypothetical protein
MELQLRLQGMDVPFHFIPGSFHTLAETLDVGWHPRYREVLLSGATGSAASALSPRAPEAESTRDEGKP